MEPDELEELVEELKEIKRKFGTEVACAEALLRWRWPRVISVRIVAI